MAQTRKAAASSKSTSKKASGSSSAIALLTSDHAEVKQMFEAYEALVTAEAGEDERQTLAMQICEALTVHATIEEEFFYPAARDELEEQDLLNEAEVEHACAKELVAQLESMQATDELYDATVKVLGEYIDHHVREEEGETFPKVKEASMDLKALGAEMLARKEELQAELEAQKATDAQ